MQITEHDSQRNTDALHRLQLSALIDGQSRRSGRCAGPNDKFQGKHTDITAMGALVEVGHECSRTGSITVIALRQHRGEYYLLTTGTQRTKMHETKAKKLSANDPTKA